MKPTKRTQLTQDESERLTVLEPIIREGMASFVEVGQALLEISDKRLYRATHDTFREYCQDRWEMSAQRAYQLCEAAEVIKAFPEKSTIVDKITTESQARELARVPEPKRADVLEAAVTKAARRGKPLTAASIKEAAEESEVDANEVTQAEIQTAGGTDSDPSRPVFHPRLDAIIDAVEAAAFDLQAFRDGTEQFTPGGAEDVADALRTAAAAIISEGKRMKKLKVA